MNKNTDLPEESSMDSYDGPEFDKAWSRLLSAVILDIEPVDSLPAELIDNDWDGMG